MELEKKLELLADLLELEIGEFSPETNLDDLEEFVPVEKEEKPSSQTKIRRGYIPLKFHSHEEEK